MSPVRLSVTHNVYSNFIYVYCIMDYTFYIIDDNNLSSP